MRVLAFGDSLTAGYYNFGGKFHPYADRLSALLTTKVDHIGMSGATVAQMVKALDSESSSDVCGREWPGMRFLMDKARAEGAAYTHVVILAGTNDLCTGQAPRAIARQLCALHEAAHCRGALTLALTVPQIGAEKSMPQVTALRNQLNEQISEFARQNMGKVGFVDLDKALPHLSLDNTQRMEIWEIDGLHLTPKGSDRIADAVFETVKSFAKPMTEKN